MKTCFLASACHPPDFFVISVTYIQIVWYSEMVKAEKTFFLLSVWW